MYDTLVSIPWLNQAIAAAALSAPLSYLETNASEYAVRASMVESFIKSIASEIGHRRQVDECPVSVLHAPQAGHGILVKFAGDARDELGGTASVRITRCLLREQRVGVGPASSMGFDGAGEIRIGFASVGLKSTYRYSAAREMQSMLDALVTPLSRYDKNLGDALAGIGATLEATEQAADFQPDEIWAEGRRFIENGFQRIRDYLNVPQ